jgi:protein ImuB
MGQGLAAGMTLADARARCPTLVTHPADPPADARELDRLLEAMRHFTPMVAPDAPDGLILDISGCTHLFGGAQALARQARAMAGYASRPGFGTNALTAISTPCRSWRSIWTMVLWLPCAGRGCAASAISPAGPWA